MPKLVDLSHKLYEGMPAYPGLPVPHFPMVFTHEESAERALYPAGTTFQIARYDMGGNTSTYATPPSTGTRKVMTWPRCLLKSSPTCRE